MSSMEKIVQRQIERWSIEAKARQEALESQDEPAAPPLPWVCVGRQFGSGGGSIARRLALRLNYRLFDRELIEAMAGESERRVASLELLDEKVRSAIGLYVDGLIRGGALLKSDYLRPLMEIVLAIGAHGAAVILGRGANLILDPERGFSARIVAPLEYRVKATVDRLNLTNEDARERVAEIDQARDEFIRGHFQRDTNDPTNYDIVLNTAQLDQDSAVWIIEEAFRKKMERIGYKAAV